MAGMTTADKDNNFLFIRVTPKGIKIPHSSW
jgi:hypothetical protein